VRLLGQDAGEEARDRPVADLRPRNLGVDLQLPHEILRRQPRPRVGAEARAKFLQSSGVERHARCLAMPSELAEQFGHRFQRLQQMKHGDAAPRALRQPVFDPQHERGPVKPLHHAAGDDSHHAAMPAFAREHQGGIHIGDRLLDALLEDRLGDLALGLLAVFIQLVELFGQRSRLNGIVGEKHFDHIGGAGHASGCVDARRDAKCHLPGAGRGTRLESRHVEQRAQARIPHVAQPFQSALHDHAVFAGKRHHIGHRGNRHQLQQRIDQPLAPRRVPAQGRNECVDQLQRHARAAQVLFRVSAIGTIGIEHGRGGRQLGFRQMVIGDDHVDAQPSRVFHHRVRPDAGIHADDEGHSARGGLLHHFTAHAVAVAQAVRDMEAGLSARELDGLGQNDYGAGAVHVVVAV